MTSGGITAFDQAEGILARGAADIVAAARQSLADPDWFLKMRLGLGHLVRQIGRLGGDVMKTHKGQVEAADVTRIAEDLLQG